LPLEAELIGATTHQAGLAVGAAAVQITALALCLLAAGGQNQGAGEGAETMDRRHVGQQLVSSEKPSKNRFEGSLEKEWPLD
jgi:ADP-ribosylglycohydrolase